MYIWNMKKIITLLSFIGIISCQSQPLETVKTLDVNQYAGTWYEIARLPNRFEKDLEYVTATYELMENGKIKVINRGMSISEPGKKSEITGKAWVPDSAFPGKLKVQFFWPFSGRYWVISLDPDYRYALVGDPSRKFLWILSKDKQLNQETYLKLVQTARDNGFETDKLVLIKQ
jgi:apolipoprotein D and lipocalin family protein